MLMLLIEREVSSLCKLEKASAQEHFSLSHAGYKMTKDRTPIELFYMYLWLLIKAMKRTG